MSEHEQQLSQAVEGFRAFVGLLGGVDEANFHVTPDGLYWLLHPLLSDLERCLDEYNKANADPAWDALTGKWERERMRLQDRQNAESRAAYAIKHPDMPRAPVYMTPDSKALSKVAKILKRAKKLNSAEGSQAA